MHTHQVTTAALLGLFALSTAQQGMQAVYASDLTRCSLLIYAPIQAVEEAL